MNNLKFRAWSKKDKVMYDLIGFILKKNIKTNSYKTIDIITKSNKIINFDLKDVVLMQSTGLTDVNGKDIYEGDLLNGDYYSKYPLICKFEDCAFRVEIKYCGDNILKQEAIDFFKLEVIGNIYENKELMENE